MNGEVAALMASSRIEPWRPSALDGGRRECTLLGKPPKALHSPFRAGARAGGCAHRIPPAGHRFPGKNVPRESDMEEGRRNRNPHANILIAMERGHDQAYQARISRHTCVEWISICTFAPPSNTAWHSRGNIGST